MNPKWMLVMLLGIFLVVGITGCGSKRDSDTAKGESYFNAVVLEVKEDAVLVEPLKGEEELKSADKILVSTRVMSTNEVPAMESGTYIRIVYNGEILESYPAQINKVFSIYLVDEKGELLE